MALAVRWRNQGPIFPHSFREYLGRWLGPWDSGLVEPGQLVIANTGQNDQECSKGRKGEWKMEAVGASGTCFPAPGRTQVSAKTVWNLGKPHPREKPVASLKHGAKCPDLAPLRRSNY